MQRISDPQEIEHMLTTLPADALITIIAGAGTGKTHNLTKRYVALLTANPELRPEHIVVLTFTDKAATEMRARIVHAVTSDPTLRSRFDRLAMASAQISTFHVFAAQIALRHSIALQLSPTAPIVDQDEAAAQFEHIWDRFINDPFQQVVALDGEAASIDWQSSSTYAAFREVISDAKGRGEDATVFVQRFPESKNAKSRIYQQTAAFLYQRYAEHYAQSGALDLDDLIRVVPEVLRDFPHERSDIRVVMFDEFQDTSAAQYTMMHAMTPNAPENPRARFVVGDPRQSIYLWRQAQPENLQRIDASTTAANRLSLRINHRSKPPILTLANQVLAQYIHDPAAESRAFDPDEILSTAATNQSLHTAKPAAHGAQPTPLPEAAGVILREFPDAPTEANAIAVRISEMRALGIELSTMAVLVRSRRAALPIIAALQTAGIPVDDGALTPFYKIPLVLDAIHVLLAGADPYNELSLTRTVWQATNAYDEHALARVRSANRGIPLWDILCQSRAETSVVTLVAALRAAHAARLYAQPMQWAKHLLTTVGLWDRDGAYGARVLHRALLELCTGMSTVAELITVIRDAPRSEIHADTPELRSNLQAVRVMTVHAAKGLEFAAVFVPQAQSFVAKNPFRTPTYKTGVLLDEPTQDETAAYRLQNDNEVITLFYVAVTRAEYWLWVSGNAPKPAPANGSTAKPRAFRILLQHFVDNPHPGIAAGAVAEGIGLSGERVQQERTAPKPVIQLPTKPLVTLTPSTLAELVSCPRRYRFLRRSGLAGLELTGTAVHVATAVPAQRFIPLIEAPSSATAAELPQVESDGDTDTDARLLGTLFHRVCELHVLTPQHDAAALVAAACAGSTADISAASRSALHQLTVQFLASPLGTTTEGVRVERHITWEWDRPAARVRFSGVIDRYDGTTITDYKTDVDLDGLAERHGNQLRLYGLALAAGVAADMPQLALYHARTASIVPVDTSAAAIAATHVALDTAIAVLIADEFPAQPSARCHGCPVLDRCDAGKRFVRGAQ